LVEFDPTEKGEDRIHWFRSESVRAVNGLPKPFVTSPLSVLVDITSDAGNYLQKKFSSMIDINENFGSSNTFTEEKVSYEYNEEGLPTRISSNGFDITLRYKRYK